MAAGAAAATVAGLQPGQPHRLVRLADADAVVVTAITLIAIAIGAIAANALNIYSGAMSFLAIGIRSRSPCVARSWRSASA